MLALINGFLLSAVLFIGILVSVSALGQARFAQLTRPPSQGYLAEVMKLKAKAATNIQRPKLVVVSGSGGIYGISCATITQTIQAPCVNLALPIEAGLPAILNYAKTYIKAGDAVLLPMEYAMYYLPQYSGLPEKKDEKTSLTERMASSDWGRLMRVDLTYALFSMAENIMAASGYKSFSIDALFTPMGDRKGHTKKDGLRFADKVAKEPIHQMSYKHAGEITEGFRYHMGAFLQWAKDNDVRAIGTLQPAFKDWAVPQAWVTDIQKLYVDAGASFYLPKDLFRYPRSDFYDGDPHLNEEAAALHSRALAKALAPYLPADVKKAL